MANRRRSRGIQGVGTITQLPSCRWRLRVTSEGRQITYATYLTEDLVADAQARWRLTHLLPPDDDKQIVDLLVSVAVGGVRCEEWFARWPLAKKADDRRVRVNNKRGGAESTAERDRAYWSWWAPALGTKLPNMVTQRDVIAVLEAMEKAWLAPLTIKTWSPISASEEPMSLRVSSSVGLTDSDSSGGVGRRSESMCYFATANRDGRRGVKTLRQKTIAPENDTELRTCSAPPCQLNATLPVS
jgi:hypothetical protein